MHMAESKLEYSSANVVNKLIEIVKLKSLLKVPWAKDGSNLVQSSSLPL